MSLRSMLAGGIWSRIQQRVRRSRARGDPAEHRRVGDLERAGATVLDYQEADSGTRIHVEFPGRWDDLKDRVALEYRLIAEQPSADEPTNIALRPGPG